MNCPGAFVFLVFALLPSCQEGDGRGGPCAGADCSLAEEAGGSSSLVAGGGSGNGSSTGGTFAGGATSKASGGGMSTSSGGALVFVGGAPGVGGEVGTGGVGEMVGSGGTPGAASGGGTGGTQEPVEPVTFRNPLNESHGSDPWMTYFEGNYYLAATTWGDTLTMAKGSSIEELKTGQATVIWRDDDPSRCCNMWAPEFHLLDGPLGFRWYHYYTAGDGNDLGTQRSHVLISDGLDPMGPYSYAGQLLDYWAIDGSVLTVEGQNYFMFSAWEGETQNIYVMEMSDPTGVVGERTRMSWPEFSWEREGSDSVNEGPEPLYHEGRTFVSYSASQCADPGYKLGLLELTGVDPLDPAAWDKSQEAVFQAANGAFGSGHNGFFSSPDGSETWLVFHATDNPAGSCWTDRTTRIQRIEWSSDGRPLFGEPVSLSESLVVPSGE